MNDAHDAIAYLEALRSNSKKGERTAGDEEAIQTILASLNSGRVTQDGDFIYRLIDFVVLALREAQSQDGPPAVPHWHSRGALPGTSGEDRDRMRKLLSLVSAVGCNLMAENGKNSPSHLSKGSDFHASLDHFIRVAVNLASGKPSKESSASEWGRATVLQVLVGSAAQTNTAEDAAGNADTSSLKSKNEMLQCAWTRIAACIGGQSLWELAASLGGPNIIGAVSKTEAAWVQAIIHTKLRALSDCFAAMRGFCFEELSGSSTRHKSETGGTHTADTGVVALTTTTITCTTELSASAPELARNAILPVLAFLEANQALGDDASDLYNAGTGRVNPALNFFDNSASRQGHLVDPLQGLAPEQQQQVTFATVKESSQDVSYNEGDISYASEDNISKGPVEKGSEEGWLLPGSFLDTATVAVEFPWARDRFTRNLALNVLNTAGTTFYSSSASPRGICVSIDDGEANKSINIALLFRHQLWGHCELAVNKEKTKRHPPGISALSLANALAHCIR